MTSATDRWFSSPVRRTAARAQLFCLPYAGGGASVFRAWPRAFGPEVEVLPVQLPGRESRFAEPAVVDAVAVAEAIAARADRPFAVFGHSMGGRLGFEVVRELRRTGRELPVRLYASGARPPDVMLDDGPFDGASRVSDEELTERLARGGGVPAEVLNEPELLELVLPVIRTDFGWLDDYSFTEEPPLPVPVVVFAGEGDTIVTPAEITGWARHTTAGCHVHHLPGGHFFLNDHGDELVRLIEADLLAATR
ncbi:MAG TPA: alpha/beta fold hydrolase [Pseudonocardiaceae bacterium]